MLLSANRVGAALIFIILATGGFSAYRQFQTVALAKQSLALTAELATEQQTFTQLDNRRSGGKSRLLEAEISRIEKRTQDDQQILSLLKGGDLGDTKGYASYMAAFARQIIAGVWLTGFEIIGAGSHMTIQGKTTQADRVPAYLTRLNQEPVLRGKSFASLQLNLPKQTVSSDDKPRNNGYYVEFQISSEELHDKETPLPALSSEEHLTNYGKSLDEQHDKFNQQLAPVRAIADKAKEMAKAP